MSDCESDAVPCRLAALTTAQQQTMGMQGAGQGQQGLQQPVPSFLPAAAMYGEAPSLPSEGTLSQRSSVASLQQMLASGHVDERLLSTLQGLSVRQSGIPSAPSSLAGSQGLGLGQASGLQQPHLTPQQQQAFGLMSSSSDGSATSTSAGSLTRRDVTSDQAASAQQLWQALGQAGQPEPQVIYGCLSVQRLPAVAASLATCRKQHQQCIIPEFE